MPSDHLFATETFIRLPRDDVFAFFAAAENLQRITPPELGFEILTPLPIAMDAGSRIDYRLRLFGAAFQWHTLISTWEPPFRFVDEQIRGPYRKWVHTHTFYKEDAGTRVVDEVRYRLPLWPVGEIAYPIIRLQLNRIFRYRRRRMLELLGVGT
ncbi:MAG: SRPBCC family protein [Rhodothermales bacterium]